LRKSKRCNPKPVFLKLNNQLSEFLPQDTQRPVSIPCGITFFDNNKKMNFEELIELFKLSYTFEWNEQ